ncbi:MAG: 23S rRNA (uracil(1939)-C(5))-methyltransferase RlmD [Lachnospiraceae bacterium]|nr:23S rRNA (uracil(1939)-C(5))-methyltransferase RlmD [Lachnospiraceae bacterium]
MKKGDILEGIVETVEFPNKGIVTIEGKSIVVKNTIPGEKVKFAINKARKGKMEARLLEVLEQADNEILSDCPHFGECGGCVYRTLPYEEQLALKEQQLLELLSKVGCEHTFQGVKQSPRQNEYRNKMEFSFGDAFKDGPLSLGMHKRGSFYDIVAVTHCKLVDEDYRKILNATLNYFAATDLKFFHKMTHLGFLRHLLVRKAVKTGEILIDIVTTTQKEFDFAPWVKLLCELDLEGTIAGILHTKNDSLADVVKDEGTEILYGENFFYEELLGLKFKISPFSFFQTNSLGAEVLYDTVREYIGATENKKIYDLYSGTGTIAQILAPVASHVTGVEIVEEAVVAAKENAAHNQLMNCEFIAGDVLKVLDSLTEKPDLIVLDPPRDGIHPKALPKIIAYGVERMLYISCKPTSLVRDLEVLLQAGYVVEKSVGVDLFPATANIETVVQLVNIGVKPDYTVDFYNTVSEEKNKICSC